MKHYHRNKVLSLCAFVLSFALLTFSTYLWTKQLSYTLLTAGVCLLSAGSVAFLLWNEQSYQQDLLTKLSALVSTITELREDAIFPENEDTMLSKLQNQVIKLSDILKAQKKQTQHEKAEMETLISDLSHQLKTPIATLTLYAELLEQDSLTQEEQASYTAALNEAVCKLRFLTDSMIKMSRLETGLIHLNPQENLLSETILTAVKGIMAKARAKQIDISFLQEKELSTTHDRNWTAEAIFNILENGVKYTPVQGNITITVIPYELFVRIDIADNGIGIASEEQAKIFSRFYRGSNSGTEDGLGIGLYLSRKIITKQNGYIKVKSNQNGTQFSVFLPL